MQRLYGAVTSTNDAIAQIEARLGAGAKVGG